MVQYSVLVALMMLIQVGDNSEDAVAKAKDFREYNSLAEEFSLEDYAMTVDISVESTPESVVLFSSTGRYEFLKENVRQLSVVSWRANIINDERQGLFRDMGIAFVRGEESLCLVQGKSHLYLGEDNLFRQAEKNDPRGPFYGIMKPFWWPVHYSAMVERMGEDVNGLAGLLSNKICFRASESGDVLESFWTVPSRSMGFIRLRSKDNLLLQFDLFWREKAVVLNEINVEDKAYKVMISCKTNWSKFGDADVPSEVRAMERQEFKSGFIEHYSKAKLEFFSPESDVYKKMLRRKADHESQLEKQNKDAEKLSK